MIVVCAQIIVEVIDSIQIDAFHHLKQYRIEFRRTFCIMDGDNILHCVILKLHTMSQHRMCNIRVLRITKHTVRYNDFFGFGLSLQLEIELVQICKQLSRFFNDMLSVCPCSAQNLPILIGGYSFGTILKSFNSNVFFWRFILIRIFSGNVLFRHYLCLCMIIVPARYQPVRKKFIWNRTLFKFRFADRKQ